MAEELDNFKMNISNFPSSRGLKDIPNEWLSKIIANSYAFHSYSHQREIEIRDNDKIACRVLGRLPVWYVSREPIDAPTGTVFRRSINGSYHWFYKSNSEFVAFQFGLLEGEKLMGNAATFSHLEYDDRGIPRISSIFIASVEFLTRIGSLLDHLRKQAAYPRIVIIPQSGQCGLLVTTNHQTSWQSREHLIYPLPELSLGRTNWQGDDFRDSKMSLEQFVLSSGYPMEIAAFRGVDLN
ncbi:hypothetical protein [Delftia sp. RIT313]|uniref:hypothetical protein n=1 Tax=Delftia sp. RIT313 TaxID=1468410 RepID=UPI00044EEBFB|nr:hypothetical protein [Delftia sp. RIT313]EZP52283.1 hypothetical protein BW39_03367 [Delftia sp. RIT313]